MTVKLKAPYPQLFVTTILPEPEFNNERTPDGRVFVKRSMLGRRITYRATSDTETLVLQFILTRMKSLELEAFVNAYQSAPWQIEFDHDSSIWTATLVGRPVVRAATGRLGTNAEFGPDEVDVTLTLSGTKLS